MSLWPFVHVLSRSVYLYPLPVFKFSVSTLFSHEVCRFSSMGGLTAFETTQCSQTDFYPDVSFNFSPSEYLHWGPGEMVQLVNYLPQKHEDLSPVLKTHTKRWAPQHTCNPSVGRQRREGPWDQGASQFSLTGDPASEEVDSTPGMTLALCSLHTGVKGTFIFTGLFSRMPALPVGYRSHTQSHCSFWAHLLPPPLHRWHIVLFHIDIFHILGGFLGMYTLAGL